MNCEQIEVWISAAQDGELDSRRQRLVEDHLATCAGCRELAAEWSALERTLRSELVRCAAPETLHCRVMRQIPEPAAAPIGRRGSWTPGGWFSFGLVPVGAAAAWMLLTANLGTQPQKAAPVPGPGGVVSTAVGPASPSAGDAEPEVKVVKRPTTSPEKSTGPKNGVGGTTRPQPTEKPLKVRPSGKDSGTRRKYDPLRGLRELRPRRKRYPLVDNSPRRRYRRPRDLRRDAPLRVVAKPEPPRTQVLPPTTDEKPMRTATLPRVTVVDYVLPQAPAATPPADAASDTQFVLRDAQPQEVAQIGYEF